MNIKINTVNDLIKFVKINFNQIKKITLLFFFLGIIKSLCSDVLYESNITLYPAGELSEKNNLLSQYSDYMESMSSFSSTFNNNYYLPDIIQSNNLKKEIINKKWNTFEYNQPISLIEYWEIGNQRKFVKINNFINKIFKGKYYNRKINIQNNAISKLDELISVEENNSGLIKVSVLMDEPMLASDIANFISDYTINFIHTQQKIFANKTKDFILDRMNLSIRELNISEEVLTEFRRSNPLPLDTPDLQLERARLNRAVEVNQEVYVTLREQLEIAKIEASKERLFINVLDEAEPNHKKEKPKRFLLIVIFTFFGFFLAILYKLLTYNIRFNN